MQESAFVPRIVICGDEAKFLSQVRQRAFKIVGQAKISGDFEGEKFNFAEDHCLLIKERLCDLDEIKKILMSGEFDYLIFTDFREYVIVFNFLYNIRFLSSKVITVTMFNVQPLDFFYDAISEQALFTQLKSLNIKTILDIDAYFLQGVFFTKTDYDELKIDCISEDSMLPIRNNIYDNVYRNLSEVSLKHYDAALITERTPLKFNSTYSTLMDFVDRFVVYVRMGSELEKHILSNVNSFASAVYSKNDIDPFIIAGRWYFLKPHKASENLCIYVVTYKDIPLERPPEGYKIIQGGRAFNKDFGYIGDHTGDNISYLNVYLNELTALYWIWKNTNHTVVGLCHYRRFLTESIDSTFSYEKILSKERALRFLEDYDIIVSKIYTGFFTQREFIKNDCGDQLREICESIFRKYIIKVQPDYVEAFDYVMNLTGIYKCHLFITRRNVFDAYCRWLFSFLVDVTNETIKTLGLANLPFSPRRLVAFFAERMLTVWLVRHNLRIKELTIMQVEGL